MQDITRATKICASLKEVLEKLGKNKGEISETMQADVKKCINSFFGEHSEDNNLWAGCFFPILALYGLYCQEISINWKNTWKEDISDSLKVSA